MCKIYIKPWNASTQELESSSSYVLGNSEKDGYGYAAIGRNGSIFGERWTNPKARFKQKKAPGLLEKILFNEKFTEHTNEYDLRGIKQNQISAFIAHGRQATCGVNIQNTHPFRAGDTWLIHNGVIWKGSQEKFPAKSGTCDSESILKAYLSLDVANNFGAYEKLFQELDGSFACGVLAKSQGRWICDVFLNDGPTLFGGITRGTPVYCTNPYALLKGNKCKTVNKLLPGSAFRFDVEAKKPIEADRFKTGERKSYTVYSYNANTNVGQDRSYGYGESQGSYESFDHWASERLNREPSDHKLTKLQSIGTQEEITKAESEVISMIDELGGK
jgi:hypothetical protein